LDLIGLIGLIGLGDWRIGRVIGDCVMYWGNWVAGAARSLELNNSIPQSQSLNPSIHQSNSPIPNLPIQLPDYPITRLPDAIE
jgi:hypothetical protein